MYTYIYGGRLDIIFRYTELSNTAVIVHYSPLPKLSPESIPPPPLPSLPPSLTHEPYPISTS